MLVFLIMNRHSGVHGLEIEPHFFTHVTLEQYSSRYYQILDTFFGRKNGNNTQTASNLCQLLRNYFYIKLNKHILMYDKNSYLTPAESCGRILRYFSYEYGHIRTGWQLCTREAAELCKRHPIIVYSSAVLGNFQHKRM